MNKNNLIILNTSSQLGVEVEENLRSLDHSYVIYRFVMVQRLVNKIDALESFEDNRHDDLEGVLSEGLSHTDALACEEWHEGHRVVVAALSKSLRLKGVVVFAPLVFVVM